LLPTEVNSRSPKYQISLDYKQTAERITLFAQGRL